jgi:hydroxypyruvate reductase/glycerate 2-kinase
MDPKKLLENLLMDGLEACSPSRVVKNAMKLKFNSLIIKDNQFDLQNRPVYLLAVGKASVPMFNSAADILAGRINGSLVITSDERQAESCKADEVIVGAHPVPKESSLKAGQRAIRFLEEIPHDSFVLNLLSGGTSSLLCLPPKDISISELNTTFELLNNSGATIREINTVRKHCSQVKGGQLLRWLDPNATLIDLVISDVPDDDLSIIGSGPTTPDLSTFQDAYHILLEYDLWDLLPLSVQKHVEMGVDGEMMETLKPGKDPLKEHSAQIISSARKLALKISDLANQRGYITKVADDAFNEDVSKVAESIENVVSDYIESGTTSENTDSRLFIFYGESTVDVKGDGKGGRNLELALRGALKITGHENITWLSAGTDGVDGPTDAAGAIVDGYTISKATGQDIDPQYYLDHNDSYHFHQQLGTLLKTGPTGNNLMDIVMVLVNGSD